MPIYMQFDDQGNCTAIIHGSANIQPTFSGFIEVQGIEGHLADPTDFTLDNGKVTRKNRTEHEKELLQETRNAHAFKPLKDHVKSNNKPDQPVQ